jgi:hypothetical protein
MVEKRVSKRKKKKTSQTSMDASLELGAPWKFKKTY